MARSTGQRLVEFETVARQREGAGRCFAFAEQNLSSPYRQRGSEILELCETLAIEQSEYRAVDPDIRRSTSAR